MKASPIPSKVLATAKLKILEHEYNVAWRARDLPKCMTLLDQVLLNNPRNINALLLRGRMHGIQYDYDAAIESFEKGVEVSIPSQQALVTLEAGKMAMDFFDPTIAESLFEVAVEYAGSVPAKLALAEQSIRLRKTDVARRLIDEVLKSAPMEPTASLLWCRLNEDQVEACEERLVRLVDARSEEIRAKAGYHRAKMLDAAGDYDGAIKALKRAKEALMKARDPIVAHRQHIRARMKALADEFTPSMREQWRANAGHYGPPKKLALLGGHPRSGTTLLEQILDSHPEMVSAEETGNFNIFAYSPLIRSHPGLAGIMDVLEACTLDQLKNARQEYFSAMEKCLDQPIGSRLLVDKNPSLTPLAPALARLFPEMKMVIMIRDPRDVILSCYMQSFVPLEAISGNFLTLEDTADEVDAFMNTWHQASKSLGAEVCELRYEELVENVEANVRKVLDFLGMEWNEAVMDYDRHAREKIVRSPTAEAVTEKVHGRATQRWKNYEKHLEPVFDKISGSLSSLGYA